MIVFLVSRAHGYTHQKLQDTGRFDLEIRSYRRTWNSFRLPRATYIFSDLDRLDFWKLELAARLHRSLSRAGVTVLNDPARVRQRYGLLKTLHARGLNRFDVWRVEEGLDSVRFPAFLRTASAHRGPLTDLLHDVEEARVAVEDALERGVPRREMILVEYRAEPVKEGIFRKLGAFRVGERLVPTISVHDDQWAAKDGKRGLAGEELYRDEHEIVVTNRYEDELWPAFEAGEIEYGRADFGLVEGRVEVYEINTNPMVEVPSSHPFPIRLEAARIAFEKLVEAFEAVDTPGGGRLKLDDEVLRKQRRRDLWGLRSPWIP